jgi:hypothetical protein
MKLHRFHWAGMLLLGVMALAPAAADARSYNTRYAGARPYVGAPYRIYPDENRWGRSYHYEDPYCGIQDSYLSRLTSHYDECGHPRLVYMIDNRTGWVINTYAREHDHWCTVSSGYTSIREYEQGHDVYAHAGYWDD